jgi:hypothetical protein
MPSQPIPRYRAYILGSNSACDNPAAPAPWGAIAEGGCLSGFCRTWYRPGPANGVNIYAHELGHNLFMHHSRKGTSEYGDGSCVLGAPDRRCFNAPHAWQLGWGGALAWLNASNFAANTTRSFVVPAMDTTQVCWSPTCVMQVLALSTRWGSKSRECWPICHLLWTPPTEVCW